ncbi:MAG TPA: hypothetical protein ENN46_00405 [Candidatus Woesearchaeota archaeon]|nr:hypothetical protein [Candidatus Woesearchaeota archaeon]
MIIEGETIYGVWRESLKHVIENGIDFRDENSRICREVFNLNQVINKPWEDTTKCISILSRFKEWKFPPAEEIAAIMISKKLAPEYSYSYGPRLFNFQGRINQIDNFIVPLLKKNPNSRRATVVLWDHFEDVNPAKRDIPSLIMIDFKIRENRINTSAVIRSNDLFFGWSANVYQLFVLSEYVRKEIGCDRGLINTISISAHLFEDQFEFIRKILKEK